MLPKVAFLLAAVCFAQTLGGVRYGGRPRAGGQGGIPGGDQGGFPGGIPGGDQGGFPGGIPGGDQGGFPGVIPGGDQGGFPGVIPGGDQGGFPGGPGGPIDIPGGISQCQAITPYHVELAQRAVGLMGNDYSFRRLHGVRTQVVSGAMYHFELHVSRTKPNSVNYCENCDVRAWHQPWMEPNGLSIEPATCTEACCH